MAGPPSPTAPAFAFTTGGLTVSVLGRHLKLHYVYPEELNQLTATSNWFGLCSVFFGGVFGTAVTAWAAWITIPDTSVKTSAAFLIAGITFAVLSVFFGIALCRAYGGNTQLLGHITSQMATVDHPNPVPEPASGTAASPP